MSVPDHQDRGSIPVEGRFQVEEILRTCEPSLIHLDEVSLERFPSLSPPFEAGLRSLLAVPLVSNDKVIVILSARSMQVDAYTPHHVDLLLRVGSQIAGAIANSQLYEERKQAEEKERAAAAESSTLAEIGKIISSSLDIDEVLATSKSGTLLVRRDQGDVAVS